MQTNNRTEGRTLWVVIVSVGVRNLDDDMSKMDREMVNCKMLRREKNVVGLSGGNMGCCGEIGRWFE